MTPLRQDRTRLRRLLEPVLILALFGWFWLCRRRRIVWKRRAGPLTYRNLMKLARNAAFMLSGSDLLVRGDLPPRDRGAIIYSIHFGVWELVPRTLSGYGYRLGILTNRYPKAWGSAVNRLLLRFRSGGGIRIFYPDDVRPIVEFLRAGGLFAVLVDGNDLYSKFEPIRKLSRLCAVPLIPFAAYQDRGRGLVRIGSDLDRLVRDRPCDYLWAYRSRES